MALPDWAPALTEVAVHVPWLTVSVANPGSQAYLNDFTADTSPDDAVATEHIGQATTTIAVGIPTMPDGLKDFAGVVAAWMAAASLAVAYARTDDDVRRAAALTAAATAWFKRLTDAADNSGADVLSPVPVLVAPDPVPWGDSLLIDGTLCQTRSFLWPE